MHAIILDQELSYTTTITMYLRVNKESNDCACEIQDRTIDECISDIFTACESTGKVINKEHSKNCNLKFKKDQQSNNQSETKFIC